MDIRCYYITGPKPQWFGASRIWQHDLDFFMKRSQYVFRGDYLGSHYILCFSMVKSVETHIIEQVLSKIVQNEAEQENAQY